MPRYSLLAALALCAGVASAQTQLELTYTPSGGAQQTCIYTTDANNVALKASGALGANGTFGVNCPNGSTTPPVGNPSFVNGLAGDVMAAVTTGGTAALSWQADADTCSYDGNVFPAGVSFGTSWPATGVACSSAATCNVLHSANLILSANGSYKFRLTCSKNGNATTVSSEVNTIASTPTNPTGCTGPGSGITRQYTGYICEQNDPDNCTNGDLTKFENIFGGGTKLWPGTRGLPKRIKVNRNQFVSLAFTVPTDFSNKGYGGYVGSEINTGGSDIPYITMTVSPTCGDFAIANPISTRCLLNQGGGAASVIWSTYPAGTTTYNESCHLTPGQTYYLNIIYAPLSRPDQSSCPDTSCNRTIKNDLGAF